MLRRPDGRLCSAEAAGAVDGADSLGRPRAVREHVLQLRRLLPDGRRRAARRGRPLLDHGRVDDVVVVSGTTSARRRSSRRSWRIPRCFCGVPQHVPSTRRAIDATLQRTQVAEAALVGVPHDVKGSALYAFVTLTQDAEGQAGDELAGS